MKYEAPDYSDEGVDTFKKTAVYNEDYIESIKMYGAYKNDKIVGVIATRNSGSHIALFFVDGQHHRKGIGKKLFQTVLDQSTADELTVNSSPYAQEVYRHLGFEDTALYILNDEKPTAVRQALAALSDVVRYKPDLRGTVKKAVSDINYLRHKETMHSLIAKDIGEVLSLIKEVGE